MGGGGRNKLYTNSSKRTLNPMDKYRKKLKMKEKEKNKIKNQNKKNALLEEEKNEIEKVPVLQQHGIDSQYILNKFGNNISIDPQYLDENPNALMHICKQPQQKLQDTIKDQEPAKLQQDNKPKLPKRPPPSHVLQAQAKSQPQQHQQFYQNHIPQQNMMMNLPIPPQHNPKKYQQPQPPSIPPIFQQQNGYMNNLVQNLEYLARKNTSQQQNKPNPPQRPSKPDYKNPRVNKNEDHFMMVTMQQNYDPLNRNKKKQHIPQEPELQQQLQQVEMQQIEQDHYEIQAIEQDKKLEVFQEKKKESSLKFIPRNLQIKPSNQSQNEKNVIQNVTKVPAPEQSQFKVQDLSKLTQFFNDINSIE